MADRVVVKQTRDFETRFWGPNLDDPESDELAPVAVMYELSPYGMMLGGLGTCTAIVLHTYAQHHGLDLREVEVRLAYDRDHKEDCQECEATDRYDEHIDKELRLVGDLTPEDREKLLRIARHCPIYKMLKNGTTVESRLLD